MESKYLLEIDADTTGYRLPFGKEELVEAAVARLQHRIKTGNLVAVHVKNPRYNVQ